MSAKSLVSSSQVGLNWLSTTTVSVAEQPQVRPCSEGDPALYEDLGRDRGSHGHRRRGRDELASEATGQVRPDLVRLYTLVGKTSGRAQGALERGEELAPLRAAQAPKRRAR